MPTCAPSNHICQLALRIDGICTLNKEAPFLYNVLPISPSVQKMNILKWPNGFQHFFLASFVKLLTGLHSVQETPPKTLLQTTLIISVKRLRILNASPGVETNKSKEILFLSWKPLKPKQNNNNYTCFSSSAGHTSDVTLAKHTCHRASAVCQANLSNIWISIPQREYLINVIVFQVPIDSDVGISHCPRLFGRFSFPAHSQLLALNNGAVTDNICYTSLLRSS